MTTSIEKEPGYTELLSSDLWQEIFAHAGFYATHALSAVSKHLRYEVLGREGGWKEFYFSSERSLAGYICSSSPIRNTDNARMVAAFAAARALGHDERTIAYAKLLMRAANIKVSEGLHQLMADDNTKDIPGALLHENISSGTISASWNTIEAFEAALERDNTDPLELPFLSLLLPYLMLTKSDRVSKRIVLRSLVRLWLDLGYHNVLWVKGIMETISDSIYSFLARGLYKEKIERLQALGPYLNFPAIAGFYRTMFILAKVQAPEATDLKPVFNNFHRKLFGTDAPSPVIGAIDVMEFFLTAVTWRIPLGGFQRALHDPDRLSSFNFNRAVEAELLKYFTADISEFNEIIYDFVRKIRDNCRRSQ